MKIVPTRRAVLLKSLSKPTPPIGPGRLLLVHHILDYSYKDKRILRILRRSLARLMREGETR
ncbi:MAG: hypothetical protein WBB46_03050, partial [Candidatus Deferrimicrobiaceae bacterium]